MHSIRWGRDRTVLIYRPGNKLRDRLIWLYFQLQLSNALTYSLQSFILLYFINCDTCRNAVFRALSIFFRGCRPQKLEKTGHCSISLKRFLTLEAGWQKRFAILKTQLFKTSNQPMPNCYQNKAAESFVVSLQAASAVVSVYMSPRWTLFLACAAVNPAGVDWLG